MITVLPGLLASQQGRHTSPAQRRAERRAQPEPDTTTDSTTQDRALVVARRSSEVLPSELFVRATRSQVQGLTGSAGLAVAELAGLALVLHGIGLLLFGRLLRGPGSTTRSRTRTSAEPWRWTLPGLSRAGNAVAHATIRLGMRTPRGRSIVLSPLVVFALFAVTLRRAGAFDLGTFNLSGGIGLATFASGICLISILPFAMNQFAIDRAGLTLSLLAPIDTRALLDGKSAGLGMIVAAPILVCIAAAYLVFPGGSLASWISLPLALWSVYVVVAPAAAALSAVFPRAVDLNSIGRGSNAHGLAGTLGLLVFGLASVAARADRVRLAGRLATALSRAPAPPRLVRRGVRLEPTALQSCRRPGRQAQGESGARCLSTEFGARGSVVRGLGRRILAERS